MQHKTGFYAKAGVDSPFDTDNTLVTSNILSPTHLAIFRSIVAFYAIVAIIFSLVWRGVVIMDLNRYFTYFTQLTFIGLCAYFIASSVQTIAYVRRKDQYDSSYSYPLQRWPRILQYLHVLLFSTISTFPIIVTIVFWTLLADGAFSVTYYAWSNITFHILNTVFCVLEILFSRCQLQWVFLPFLLLIAFAYLGLAYVTYATQGYYTYSFLNTSKNGGFVAAYIVGIAVAEVIVFVGVLYLCRLRDRVFGHRFRQGERSSEMNEMI